MAGAETIISVGVSVVMSVLMSHPRARHSNTINKKGSVIAALSYFTGTVRIRRMIQQSDLSELCL
jgi:hypothetical protein